MDNQLPITPQPTKFLLYKDANGQVKVEIYIFNETLWLTQDKIAQLFGVDRTVITKHLKYIFQTSELQEDSVCAKIAHTATDGKNYTTKFYNLDAILSVGFRVNCIQATDFRIWAILHDHGKISHEVAKELAEKEYEKFHARELQNYESDFDKLLNK